MVPINAYTCGKGRTMKSLEPNENYNSERMHILVRPLCPFST